MLAVSDNATIWRWDRVKWTETVVSELWQNTTLRLKPRDVTAELQLQRKQCRNKVVHFTNRTVFTLILIWDVINKFVFHFWIVHFLSFLSCSFLSLDVRWICQIMGKTGDEKKLHVLKKHACRHCHTKPHFNIEKKVNFGNWKLSSHSFTFWISFPCVWYFS